MAPRKYSHSQWRQMQLSDELIPDELPARERMERKLATRYGRREYDKR